MPARRRGQEAKRRARRVVRRGVVPMDQHAEVEQAWRANAAPWCCPDCDPGHPLAVQADAEQEIREFLSDPALRF